MSRKALNKIAGQLIKLDTIAITNVDQTIGLGVIRKGVYIPTDVYRCSDNELRQDIEKALRKFINRKTKRRRTKKNGKGTKRN